MTLRNQLLNWKTQLEVKRRRSSRKSTLTMPKMARVHLERLEDRFALSGFGPADGAYIVEDRQGGWYSDVKIQPSDQAIVAAGPTGTRPDGTSSMFGVERYNSAGNVDMSYGSAGLASPSLGPGQGAVAVCLQADGKAVVAGQVVIAGGVNLALARLNIDGSPDATFGSAGWTGFDVQPGTDAATAVGLQSSGKIVMAGNSNSAPNSSTGTQSALVARFKANGAIDSGTGGFGQLSAKKPTGYALTSFGARSASYNDVAVQPDDKLVAVGYDGSNRLVVARYTAAGTLDKTFNSRGYTVLAPAGISTLYGHKVALQADGKIVVAGQSTGADSAFDMLIARFNANGSLDTSFGSGNGYVRLDVDGAASVTSEGARGVAIQPDGKIVVAGDTKPGVGGPASVMVARLNTNGTLDSTFGAGGLKLGTPLAGTGYHDFRGRAVALQSDGSIIVAGLDYWGSSGDTAHPLLMRFYGSTPSPIMAFSGNAISNDSNRPSELKRVDLMAEVMYEVGYDRFAEDLANNRVASQSGLNVFDRGPSVDLLFGSRIDHVEDEGLIVPLGGQLDFEWC